MDFRLTDEQQQLQDTVRAFADRECAPLAAAWDRENRVPDHEFEEKLIGLGLYGMTLPERWGGGGRELLDAVLVIEQLARVSPLCAAGVFESSVGPVRVIERFGSEEQQARWLPKVCRGETEISIGMSEPEAGSALTDLRTTAEKVSGGYRLNGVKAWCTGGGHSRAYLVYCRMNDRPGPKGIAGLLVEKGTPGFTFGPQERYLGLRGFPSSALYFADCVVPEENLVIQPGGFASLMDCFNIERCGNATMALGIAAGALEVATSYARERRTFGRPICERGVVQEMIADMATRVDAARLLVYRAAANAGTGLAGMKETSMAKLFANETAKHVTDKAMEILGAVGYSAEYPI